MSTRESEAPVLDDNTQSPGEADPLSTSGPATGPATGPAAANPYGDPPAQRTFDKPNLVLKDPDPYAFANRIRRLTLVFALLSLLVAGPYLVSRFTYYFRYSQLRAEVDVATETLPDLKPRLQDLMTASRLVAKRIGPSVVSIQRPDIKGDQGQGSGVIVDAEGYIVTNFHVVDNAAALYVQLDDGRTIDATIVGMDRGYDLAVLKIEAPNLIAAEWGDSEELQVGDLVWAAGSPFGLRRSITFGIVSALERRSSSGVTGTAYQEYLQTDVAVNPGNSGGPLVDLEGRVVGINTAIVGESYRGISFAIPTTIARKQYQRLRKDGWIERGYLGVSPTDVPPRVRQVLGLEDGEGVFVANVIRPGPASNAGIRQGDVIVEWNGVEARDATLLSREIASTEVGSTANVVVRRLVRGRPAERTLEVRVSVSPYSVRPGASQ